MTKLILFDIDGTLVDAGDLSRSSFLHVVGHYAGVQATLDGYSLSGKTDPQIMRELLLANGLSPEHAGLVLSDALEAYQSHYLANLRADTVRPLDGAIELIERLTAVGRIRLLVGLLSGNLRGLAAPKLQAAGISPSRFVVGAFGSDNADRNELPAIAVENAERHCGIRLGPEDVVIVGDTPLDVRCARWFGAASVAVATGDFSCTQLAQARPTCVVPSLRMWSEVERTLGLVAV